MRLALAALLILLMLIPASAPVAAPQTTAFTYQGELKQNGALVNGPVNLQFRLWDDSIAGAQVAPQVTRNGVVAQNGVFTVEIDFGYVFGTDQRWIEVIAGGVPLTPRQPITVAPMAMYALSGLPGPQGVQGPLGPQGLQGAQGIQGPDGTPLVFGGTAHESANRLSGATASYVSPLGISDVVGDVLRAQVVVPAACTAGSLRLRFTTNDATYLATNITLMHNGNPATLTCGVVLGAPGTASCTDLANTVALAAGDTLAIRFEPPFPTRPVGNVESRIGVFGNFGFLCSGPP